MTIKDLHSIVQEFKTEFQDFKKNEFGHLKSKIDWLFAIVIATLLTLIVNLLSKSIP